MTTTRTTTVTNGRQARARWGLVVILAALALPALLASDAAAERMGRSGLVGRPTFLRHLFRPELIMQHQAELALTDAQRETIQTAMRETSDAVATLRWDYEAASEKLGTLLAGSDVDEAAALAEAERVMAIEQQIKRAHLGMLIRVKNALTAEQQRKLAALQPERRRPRGGDGPP